MQTVGERLLYMIENQGYTLRSFSEKFSINYSSLSELTRNNRNLGGVLLKRIAELMPDLNLNWLFLGTGNMFLHKNEDSTNMQIVSEPQSKYAESDPVEEMFLKYLDIPSVQEKIKMILNK